MRGSHASTTMPVSRYCRTGYMRYVVRLMSIWIPLCLSTLAAFQDLLRSDAFHRFCQERCDKIHHHGLQEQESHDSHRRSLSNLILCMDDCASPSDILKWKRDSLALQAAGFGASAGVVTKSAKSIRKGVHQIWLQSPSTTSSRRSSTSLLDCYVGHMDARKKLLRFVDNLRNALDGTCIDKPLPPNFVELSYLLYDEHGASYDKHIDCSTSDSSSENIGKRDVSFVLYLGDAEDRQPWSIEHGGALRIHGAASTTVLPWAWNDTSNQSEEWADLAPTAGRMVLFDSSSVWHEVLPTTKQRLCVVGWFRTPC